MARRMDANWGRFLLLSLVLATAACHGSEGVPQPAARNDGRRSYKEFVASVGSFPYSASEERRDRILLGYSKLEVGATKDEVSAALGEPDYSAPVETKDLEPRLRGSLWVYYFSKRDNGDNSFDPVVEVFFGTDGRAAWIVPRNIGGLHEKGSPPRYRT